MYHFLGIIWRRKIKQDKNMRKDKIFVTGADGFMGSHLTEALIRKGYGVRALVYYNPFNTYGWLEGLPVQIRKKIEIFLGDIRDPYRLKEVMKGCEVVFHLAALTGIPYSYQSPESYVETNISGTLNVMQSARELGLRKVIHISSSEVYGSAKFVPITEEHPLEGRSPYSASKIGAEQIALSFHYAFDVPVVVIRPFNTYGPRQSARAIIPTIITQIANNRRRIKLGALQPTRDFTYIKDMIDAFLLILKSEVAPGQIINIGSNYEISIQNLVQVISEMMKSAIKIETDSVRLRPTKSEVPRLWADNTRIKQLTGWGPKYSGIEGLRRGLSETIEWFRQADHLKFYKSHEYNV